MKARLENIIFDACCRVLAVSSNRAPKHWQSGAMTIGAAQRMAAQRMAAHLARPNFIANLDSSNEEIQFSCGAIYNCKTPQIESGSPERMLSKHCGYEYPSEELKLIDAMLREKNIDVNGVFEAIKASEFLSGGAAKFPKQVVDALDEMATLDCFTLLRLMRDSSHHLAKPAIGLWPSFGRSRSPQRPCSAQELSAMWWTRELMGLMERVCCGPPCVSSSVVTVAPSSRVSWRGLPRRPTVLRPLSSLSESADC